MAGEYTVLVSIQIDPKMFHRPHYCSTSSYFHYFVVGVPNRCLYIVTMACYNCNRASQVSTFTMSSSLSIGVLVQLFHSHLWVGGEPTEVCDKPAHT